MKWQALENVPKVSVLLRDGVFISILGFGE